MTIRDYGLQFLFPEFARQYNIFCLPKKSSGGYISSNRLSGSVSGESIQFGKSRPNIVGTGLQGILCDRKVSDALLKFLQCGNSLTALEI